MRRLMIIVGLTAVLLMTAAMPALAGGDLLGSGAAPPEGGGEAPVHVTPVSDVADTAGQALAATGIDAGAVLMVGFGLVVAGGAAVAVSRKRAAA
ncbi:MAG TPA: LPXTG cell wall anchor domain-containing protein [Euzebyales bacterium]